MLMIREVLIAKPGMASKLAKLMKDTWGGSDVKIMTDLTGVFNKVVMESEVRDLQEFEQRMKNYRENPEHRQKSAGYTEMYRTGKREIFQILE